ncbi:hypothetical protein M5K25_009152 [Dendrobium thyrsiflorum]|uniref:Uncharacterized protein n=1 Tax=Dendrobium thyrsiflorum TaxID=117978 RepID=A0ABD0V5K9_DENTH
MNLSHGIPILDPFSTSFQHLDGEEAKAATGLSPIREPYSPFGQRKKFLEPKLFSFSFESKPT